MPHMISRFRSVSFADFSTRLSLFLFVAVMAVVLASSVFTGVKAQQTSTAPSAGNQPAAQAPSPGESQPATPAPAPAQTDSQSAPSAAPAEPAPAPAPAASPSAPARAAEPAEISEDEIRRLLVGKELFLRGGYLDNDLSYNEHGLLVGHSPQGSYTLSGIQIDKVRLTKHKLELEGQRYGLHFLGAMPYEDPTKAVDQVNITPKKKVVKITIDRELVVKPKEKKEKGKAAKPAPQAAAPAPPAEAAGAPNITDDAQAEIAAAPPAERPTDAKSVTTTTSQAHANKLLEDALDNVFAQGFDSRLMQSMPDFWKLY